ncbi:VVA0879 family protein [Melioribacter sp. Ez-97]|uniref:VVA0879 family protein n=1 Tax=Melioribacter sp. Ez-97 TaxID=3423434 RepID=UPI003ED9E011
MKQMKIKEYIDLLRARHGEKIENWKVICPICKCEQTVQDFLDAGIDMKDVFNYFGYSCIGRFSEAKGCDFSLGGLFPIHNVEIIDDSGNAHPRFDIA